MLVTAVVFAMIVAACSNSKSQNEAQTTLTAPKTTQTTASASQLKENVPRPNVKGVTSTEIRVAAITSKTNPVGGKYHQLVDGMNAYFKALNDAGGIYGRKIVIAADRDDQTGLENAQMVTASLSDDNAFATFLATLQFTGADSLAKAGEPTFTWNINPEFSSTPTQAHNNIFATVPGLCFTCPGPLLSWLALTNHYTKVGIIGYGVSSESKECAVGSRDAFAQYGNGKIKVVYFDDTVGFAADLNADVARMKSAGVQLVTTCLDANEVVKLQQEMKQAGLNAVQDLPNAYDHDFLKQNGALFQGSFVQPDYYPPWESTPQSPNTQLYLQQIKAITNDPVEVTEIGWLDAQMFVDALKGAGPEFTQQKVIDWLNSQTAYDDHGMIQPINWTTGHIDPQKNASVRLKEQCQPIVEIENGKFTPFDAHPGKPWTCFDASKDADQTPTYRSFAPGRSG
jgi:ABC-type branched-subunit amino acid transport system substrate-binding protein